MTVITDLGIETPLDEYDNIREFFNDEEWEAIYDSVVAEGFHSSEESQNALNSVIRKIDKLFDITKK